MANKNTRSILLIVGWAANIVMKDWFRGMLKLIGKEKKNERKFISRETEG